METKNKIQHRVENEVLYIAHRVLNWNPWDLRDLFGGGGEGKGGKINFIFT